MANFPLSNLLDGTKKIWSVMTGAAADDAAASGNPMLVAGKYSATPATRHDGDVVTQQMTADGAALVQLSGSKVVDAVIAKDGTVSTEIDFSDSKYLSFLMPAGWDAATLTIYGSAETGGTKVAIYNDAGVVFPQITVAVDKIYSVDIHALKLAGVHYLALVASAAQTTAARTIKVMLKA